MTSLTPLPPADDAQAVAFWSRAITARAAAPASPLPPLEYFGDSVELADELLALVLEGRKRATAASHADYVREGVAVPDVGDVWLALDGRGRSRAVLRTTQVRIGPLTSVDDQFAWDEGEGDRTRASWLAGHVEFFSRWLPSLGIEFDPEMATVFVRFEVDYAEHD